jgi:hypothetical protein
MELTIIVAFAYNDFHRAELTSERTVAETELAPLYYPRNEHNFGINHGMLPEYYIFNNICCNTLTPKRGDCSSIQGSTRNFLFAILQHPHSQARWLLFSIFLWTESMYVLSHGT